MGPTSQPRTAPPERHRYWRRDGRVASAPAALFHIPQSPGARSARLATRHSARGAFAPSGPCGPALPSCATPRLSPAAGAALETVLGGRRHGMERYGDRPLRPPPWRERRRRLAADRASRPPCRPRAGRARPPGARALPAGQHARGTLAGAPRRASRALHMRARARTIKRAAGRSAPSCGRLPPSAR